MRMFLVIQVIIKLNALIYLIYMLYLGQNNSWHKVLVLMIVLFMQFMLRWIISYHIVFCGSCYLFLLTAVPYNFLQAVFCLQCISCFFPSIVQSFTFVMEFGRIYISCYIFTSCHLMLWCHLLLGIITPSS